MNELLIGTSSGVFELSGGELRPDPSFGARQAAALVARDGHVWAIADRRSIARRGPDRTWTDLARRDELEITCMLPTPDGLLVGTEQARLLRLGDDHALVRLEAFDPTEGRET